MTNNNPPERYSIKDILDKVERGRINFNPVYQRHSDAWDNKRKRDLIFTLLNMNKFIIPPLYFCLRKGEGPNGRDMYDVTDGLQRLNCIIEFVQGNTIDELGEVVPRSTPLRVGKKEQYEKTLLDDQDADNMKRSFGKTFDELDEDLQETILDNILNVFVIQGYPEKTMSNIFGLLQRSSPTNPPEKLQSINSAINYKVKNVVDNLSEFFSGLDKQDKRAAHYWIVCQMFCLALDPKVTTTFQKLIGPISDDGYSVQKLNDTQIEVENFFGYIRASFEYYSSETPKVDKYKASVLGVYMYIWVTQKHVMLNIHPLDFSAKIESFRLLGMEDNFTLENETAQKYHLGLTNSANSFSARAKLASLLISHLTN